MHWILILVLLATAIGFKLTVIDHGGWIGVFVIAPFFLLNLYWHTIRRTSLEHELDAYDAAGLKEREDIEERWFRED